MLPEASKHIPGLTFEPAVDDEDLAATIKSLVPYLADIGVDGVIYQDQSGEEQIAYRDGFSSDSHGVVRTLGDVYDAMLGVSGDTVTAEKQHGHNNIITSFIPAAGLERLTQNT